jgi:hypothetical protein
MKSDTVIALQTWRAFVHVVADIANMIKEGMNDILLAQRQVQRRSSENVVLVDHRLCVRSEQLVSMGVALPVAICRMRDGILEEWDGTAA